MKLGDYLKAINKSKEALMDSDDEFIERDYVPFVVNRCLSFFPDTIIQTNEVNLRSSMDKKMQFDFLRGTIRKGNRYSPWMKENLPKDIEVVKEYFNYSNKKAKEALEILTPEDLENIKNKLSKGGKI